MELLSTIVRIIPSIIISLSNVNIHSISLPFIHIGQILNAMCGPLAMIPVSQLSCLWFNTNERTRATTISIMAYNLGSTISFPLGPSIVSLPEDIPHLLYIHLGLSFIGFILVLIYFPGQPPTPPSPAAELLMKYPKNEENIRSLMKNICQCFRSRSFVFLVIGSGLIGGTFGVWTSLFDVILTPLNYTEKEIGWIGFCSSISEIIGGLCLSTIADMKRFNHSFKILILICFISYFLSIIWFNLSIKIIFIDKSIIPSNLLTIFISVSLAGFFQGGGSPLTYESLAEIMYPLPESLSASILVQFINLTSLILFFIAPSRYQLLNLIIIIFILICIILTLVTKFNYKRRDNDQIKRRTIVSSDVDQIDILQMDPIYQIEDTNPILRLDDS
jgi:Na+/melibiose symporter-like transporter